MWSPSSHAQLPLFNWTIIPDQYRLTMTLTPLGIINCQEEENNNNDNVYRADIMTKVIARVHPVHLTNADWAPDQANWLGRWVHWKSAATIHNPPLPLLLLLSPWADTHFAIPRRVEGWVDLSTAVKVHSLCLRLYTAVAVAKNTNILGEIRTWVLSHRSRTR